MLYLVVGSLCGGYLFIQIREQGRVHVLSLVPVEAAFVPLSGSFLVWSAQNWESCILPSLHQKGFESEVFVDLQQTVDSVATGCTPFPLQTQVYSWPALRSGDRVTKPRCVLCPVEGKTPNSVQGPGLCHSLAKNTVLILLKSLSNCMLFIYLLLFFFGFIL